MLRNEDDQKAMIGRIETVAAAFDSDLDCECGDPVRFLTHKEKLEAMGEFAQQLALIDTVCCAIACGKWVRVVCVECVAMRCFCCALLTQLVFTRVYAAATGVEVRCR